ncbi:hypothetical protein GGU11DRAFT_749163 [Lentinula aff. detonsa]|nr:hypothetical protein GGU11DRAFT_749163 [Lentinula aff. detonsa]
MSQTNPGPGSLHPIGCQRSVMAESSAPGITNVATPNPFISTARALSPFNHAHFTCIQNNETRDCTPIPEEPHVSPSMVSLRRMYQPPDTARHTRAPSVTSESKAHSSTPDDEESVHKDFQDPDVPDLPPDRELHPMPLCSPTADGGGDGGGSGGGTPCPSAANLPADDTIPKGETLALSMLHSLITSLNGI